MFVHRIFPGFVAGLVFAAFAVVVGCSDDRRTASGGVDKLTTGGGTLVTGGGMPRVAPPDVHAARPIGPYLNGTLPDVTPTPGNIQLIDAFPNLTWVDPVDFRAEPGNNRLWIAEVGGRIWSVDNDRGANQRDLVLDLRTRAFQNDRGGLLGFAFHPNWGTTGPDRGYVYVYYQWAPAAVQVDDMQPWSWAHYRRLSRFTRPDGQTAADPASEVVLIQQYAPSLLHAGGGMFFGNDGFLYLSVGDAGTFWDFDLHTQCLDKTLASGVLRIDVDRDPARSHAIRRQPVDVLPLPSGWPPSSTAGYFVPDDNPWLDAGGGILEEFWALGLRSPHRMSQDPANGDVWVGDVGQNTREEVSLVRKGDNLQWPFMEGTFSLHPRPPTVIGREVGPVWDYPRTVGNCIVAGHVYHGSLLPELQDQLISVDNVRGTVFATTRSGFTQSVSSVPVNTGEFNGASCVGVDHQGELYVCRWNGPKQSGAKVFAVVRRGAASRQPPPLLSAVRAFTDLQSLRPVSGLVPYEINAPFWSDDAIKTRFVAVPNDGVHDAPGERIGFSEEREWSFPAGTVVVKHFELPLDMTVQGGPTRRLETRFLVKTVTSWYGITYRWRPDGTEADLLAEATTDQISVLTQGGPEVRTWDYPSRGQCLQCHNGNAGFALGLTTRQLNRPMPHPTSGAMDNQLRIWNQLGIFDPPIHEARLAQLPRLAAIDDGSASIERRVRSYFDSNCSQCHRPRGIFGALFDARFTTPPAEQGIVGGALYDPRGIPGAKVVELGQPAQSLAFGRVASVDPNLRMPPIGKNHVDGTGLAALSTWIQQAQGVAAFTAATHIGPPGLPVSFQDTSTVAGTAWRWEFGDGAVSTQQNPTHVYARPGRYDVTLTVTAAGGPYSTRRAGWVVIGANVAAAGTARQSTTYNGAVASRAIDGNTDGDVNNGSVSETDFEINPWWEVDLGSVQFLSAVRLWNRTSLGKEWLAQFRVFFSEVPFVSGDLDQVASQPGVTTIQVGPMVEGSLLLDVDRTARYVRVQSELATAISLAEFEAFGAPPSSFPLDVAIGKPATQSSVDGSAPDLGADNAVDGDLAGGLGSGSLARTQRDAQAWWQVDLGAVHDIDRVVLWNRTDCCTEELANYHVLISDAAFAGSTLGDVLAQPGVWNHRHHGFVARRSEVAVGRTGRWLRVQLGGRGHLQLAEVQVIGRPATGGGVSITLGNHSNVAVAHDFGTSNLIVDKTDAHTNQSAAVEQIRIDGFGFNAWRVGDPVTPFVVRVDGPNSFTVLNIGTTRMPGDYVNGDNRFAFLDGGAPVITLPPGATIAVGFLAALPDGTGGGAGSVVSFDAALPADDVWYSGGLAAADSGSIVVGQAPVPGRKTLSTRRNYHFRVDLVRQ